MRPWVCFEASGFHPNSIFCDVRHRRTDAANGCLGVLGLWLSIATMVKIKKALTGNKANR